MREPYTDDFDAKWGEIGARGAIEGAERGARVGVGGCVLWVSSTYQRVPPN